MTRWYQIRRLRGAIFIILIGVLALLNQTDILRLRVSWPLLLIAFGLLMLAERTAWTMDLREQHAAQKSDASLGTLGLSQQQPSSSTGQSYWSTSAPSTDPGAEPLIQPQPPAPEDSGRPEDFDREGR